MRVLYAKRVSSHHTVGAYFGSQVRCDSEGRLWAKTPDGRDLEKVVIVNNAYLDLFPDYKSFVKELASCTDVKKKLEDEFAGNIPLLMAAMGI